MRKLKVGFIIDSDQINQYTLELLRLISQNKNLFFSPVLLSQQKKKLTSLELKNIYQFPSTILNRLIHFGESLLLKSYDNFSNHHDTCNPLMLELETHHITPVSSNSKGIHRFSDQDIGLIQDQKFDVLIRSGTGILKGKILNASKFGILSFHHGDNRVFRGIPAGFWEVYLNIPSTGFIIQQLTEKLDGGNVVSRGSISTSSFWLLNNARITKKSNIFMFKTLCYIAENNALPSKEIGHAVSSEIYRFPAFKILLIYLFAQIFSFAKNRVLDFLNYRYRWSVSFRPKESLLSDLSSSITINNKPNTFLADPFVVEGDGRDICFVEEFLYQNKKGRIRAYELFEESYKDLGVVLEEDFHLSFPYIFEYNNKFYMCPETAAKNDIRIYECIEFPLKWRLKNTLISNVSAADSVIFFFEDTWFMLTNICSSKISEHNSELHLYFSDNPLSDCWKPSINNPLIFNSQTARNGGLFQHNGKLYRINQRHGKGRYGVSFDINEVLAVNPSQYSEKLIKSVRPNFFPLLDGAHHYHLNKNFVVFDHCRLENINR